MKKNVYFNEIHLSKCMWFVLTWKCHNLVALNKTVFIFIIFIINSSNNYAKEKSIRRIHLKKVAFKVIQIYQSPAFPVGIIAADRRLTYHVLVSISKSLDSCHHTDEKLVIDHKESSHFYGLKIYDSHQLESIWTISNHSTITKLTNIRLNNMNR